MGLQGQARLDDGYIRGQQAAAAGLPKPVVGSKGYEQSNLTNSWMAGFDSYKKPVAAVKEKSSGGGGGAAILPQSAPSSPPRPQLVEPTMPELPKLDMSEGASTVYQLNKLQSMDSLPMQQAAANATERGVASGAIHSSQQAGAAQRAVTDKLQPMAQSEANLVGTTDIANWTAEVKKLTDVYEKQYAGYISKLGFESNQKIAMTSANTSLSTALLSSMTTLMNNPEIDFGEEVKNKLTSIYNGALQNNNMILDMGFSY